MNYKIKHDYDCLLKIAVLTNIKNSIPWDSPSGPLKMSKTP